MVCPIALIIGKDANLAHALACRIFFKFCGVLSGLGDFGLGVGLAGEVEGVGAEVLFVEPLHAAEEGFDLVEVVDVLEFGEDAFFEVGGDIEAFGFAVVEVEAEGEVGEGLDLGDFG
jgi:hypothetical protein